MDRWYNFRAKRNVQKLTPEEVEEKVTYLSWLVLRYMGLIILFVV